MAGQPVIIAAKFCGPPQSANGGYTAGLLGSLIEGPCSVTLRAPPPLDRTLQLARDEQRHVRLSDEGKLLAEAEPSPVDLALPPPVSVEQAQLAMRSYPGRHVHPYPRCFVCGTERPRGDGLGVYAGAVEGRRVVASTWLPTLELCTDGRTVDRHFVWAALDCPSWFGFSTFEADVPQSLLGRLTVDIQRSPRSDERCVVVGWNVGREGRRIECGSMLLDEQGDCIASARSTWVTLKPATA